MPEQPQEHTPEFMLRLRLDLLFSKYIDTEPSEALETIGSYYEYLAEHIDYQRYTIEIEKPLLEPFEAVSLVLREQLQVYPEAIKRQVDEVFQEAKLLKTFGLLASLGTKQIRRLRLRKGIFKYVNAIVNFLSVSLAPSTDFGISQELLLETKLALNRISQILKYAATLEVISYEQVFDDIRDHYDPTLLNKNKLLALINLLHIEVSQFENGAVQQLILAKLQRIEEEIRKPKPKWGIIITWCFVLFSFLADLKAISPSVYDRAYNILGNMVSVLHTEGCVSSTNKPQLPLGETRAPAILESADITPKRKDKEE